ncbi:MAG: GpE family phage tail protein [Marinobacterium sp.]|nr:GpE family phage tail protein [Marinobacterium sp.]
MADIATIFHWGPDIMASMSVEELADWREQARVRSGVDDDE